MSVQDDLHPKRVTKEYKRFGRRAEWMVVRDGLSLQQVCEALGGNVAIETLQQWSAKFKWQDKRRTYDKKPLTLPKMVYDLLYTELMEVNQKQVEGDRLSIDDIQKLEKLLRMHKQTGTPFSEQVANVMRVFLRFIEHNSTKGSDDQKRYLTFVRDFVEDVESGLIRPE